MPSDAELLKAYLADRDVPCPCCGYSLNGCVADKCPECGHKPSLNIHHTFWTAPRVVLVRSALCVLAAGYLLATAEWGYTLSSGTTFSRMGWHLILSWVVTLGGYTLAAIACFWVFWQSRRARRSAASVHLNRAFTIAVATPAVMSLIYIIQTVIAELV